MTWQPADRYHGPAEASLARPEPANLADVLERVLDKGIVIAGDIRIDLVDVELLTIRIRLLVASVDRAREMGIDWWRHDPMLSSRAGRPDGQRRGQRERQPAGDDQPADHDQPAPDDQPERR